MPGNVYYQDSVDRTLKSKLGERFSVLDISPTAGKGVLSETAHFLKAYNSELTKGGGTVHIPGAVGTGYRFDTPLNLTGVGAVEFVGEGRASKIFRGANMPANKGMIDLAGAKNITFRRLLFDGAVTVPVGLTYASFGEDPAHASLTLNSTVWIHGGEEITFIDCDFEHSGGYAAYLDARAAYVRRIKFINCRFKNNRPHLFGTSGGDMTYGSWTGGIFGQNQATGGSQFKVEDLRVTGCQFERNTGNCVWQHGYGFDSFHTRIHVDNNSFLDCGLDGVLFGNVTGGSCIGNSFRRIGYVCTTDVSVSVPKWLTDKNATALDTSGIVKLVTYSNNDFLSINGGAINGDGLCYATVNGNTIRVPNSSQPEYDEDHITTFGPGGVGANWSQGVVLGNTSAGEGGTGVTISGNLFDNLGGTAIGLYGARKCQAVGNLIIVPSTANQQPITIGGFGTAPNQNASDNLITENTIHYSPAIAAPAIFEDPTYRAFVGTDVNSIVKNRIIGNSNSFEFQRNPNSGSNTGLHFTTDAVVTFQHRHGIEREGKSSDSSSALRFYMQDGGTFGYLHMQLQAYRDVGVRGPLLNVGEYGPGVVTQGGVITTGNVTTSAFSNAMITGKLCATGFLAITNSTFSDPEANLLDDNWALLRWENTSNQWEQSISTLSGARVWTPFFATGLGLPALPLTSVQFNDGGVFGGSANFVFDKTAKLVTITTAAASPGINVIGGFVQSAQGFLAVAATATNYNSIQAPGGGFFGLSLNLTKYAAFTYTSSILPVGTDDFTSKVMLYADTSGGHLRLVKGSSPTGYGDWSLQCSGLYATGNSWNSIQVPLGGLSGKVTTVTSHVAFAPIAAPFVLVGADFTNTMLMFYETASDELRLVKGTALSTFANHNMQMNALNVTGTATNAIKVPVGGVFAKWLIADQMLMFTEVTTPPLLPVSGTGQVRIYADANHQMYISTNGAPWGPFGGGNPGGANQDVQWNNSGAFGGDDDFTWNNGTKLLDIFGTSGTPAISVENAFIQSQQGFLAVGATATQYNSIQAPGGGVFAKSINAANYVAITGVPGGPTLTGGDSSAGKALLWFNSDNNYLYLYRSDPLVIGSMVLNQLYAAGPRYDAVITPGGGFYGRNATVADYVSISAKSFVTEISGDSFTGKNLLWMESGTNHLRLTTGDGTTDGVMRMSGLYATNPSWGCITAVGIVQGSRYQATNTDGDWSYLISTAVHTWGMRSIATGEFQLIDYTYGNGPIIVHGSPNTTQTSICVQTPGFFRSSGGLAFDEQLVAPPLSVAGQVRIYASTDHTLKISTNTAAYGPFGGGGTPAGTTGWVQYNSAGAFAAVGDLTFDPASKTLNIGGGSTDTASRLMTNSTGQVRNPSTGVLGPNTPAGDIHWRLHRPWIRFWDIGIDPGARFVIRDGSNADMVDFAIYPSNAGDTTVIAYTPGYFQGQNGFYTPGTNYDIIKAPSGGALLENLSFNRLAVAPSLSHPVGTAGVPNGTVKLYANTNGVVYISTAGAAYGPLSGGGAPGGANQNVQWNNGAGGFGGSPDFTFNDSTNIVDLWGPMKFSIPFGHVWQLSSKASSNQFWIEDVTQGNTPFIIVPNATGTLILISTPGYYEAGYGFNSLNNQFNTFRCTGGGGVSVACLRASYYTHIGNSSGVPGMMSLDSLSFGCMYYDTSTGQVKVYTSGGWKTVSVF